MKYILIFVSMLLGIIAYSAEGQDLSKSSDSEISRLLKLNLGYSHLRIQDIQVSPFVYNTNNIPFGIGFEKQKSKSIFSIDLSFSYGILKNKTFPDRTFLKNSTNNEGEIITDTYEMGAFPIFQQGINVGYLRKTDLIPSDKFDLYLGCNLREYFLISFTVVPIFVINELSLYPEAYLKYRVNDKFNLSTSLSFPLVGIMARLPYSNDPADGKHGSFISVYTTGHKATHPSNFQKVDFSVKLSQHIRKKWQVAYMYNFQWQHYAPNRGMKASNNQFTVQFIRKLKSK